MTNSSAAPTRLSLATLRSDALHRLLLSPRGKANTVDDIPRLSDLFSWPSEQIQTAICDLVIDGRIEEGPEGELIVRRRSARAA